MKSETRVFGLSGTCFPLTPRDDRPPTPEELDLFQETVGNLKTLIPPGLSARLDDRDLERGVQPIQVDPDARLRQLLADDPDNARIAVKQIVCTVLPALDDDWNIEGVEIYDGEEQLPLTDDAAQPLGARPATLARHPKRRSRFNRTSPAGTIAPIS